MGARHLTEEQAFDVLHPHLQEHNIKLSDVARASDRSVQGGERPRDDHCRTAAPSSPLSSTAAATADRTAPYPIRLQSITLHFRLLDRATPLTARPATRV